MYYRPDGTWQFQATAPIQGTYRVDGDIVCASRSGAEDRCFSVMIGPDGPIFSHPDALEPPRR